MKKENKTYCRVPFDSVTVSPTGRMQLCCEAQWTGGVEKTKLSELSSIQDWFDGTYLESVRRDMLEGKPIPQCQTCYKREQLHGKSPRTHVNEKYFSHSADPIEHSIKKIDLKLGNKCNLKCKMCFPYASSELWKEWKDLGWNSNKNDPNNDSSWKYYDDYFEEDYSWPKNKDNMMLIKEAASKADLLHITGGEPTINPEFFDLLDYLIDRDKAKDIILDLTTNATKIHPRLFEKVRQFKELWLTISMDGIGKTYEYVRYPADYNRVHENVKRYRDFIKTLGGKSKLRFNFVLQIWNLHNAIDVVKTLTPLSVNEGVVPVAIEELDSPKFMHWSILPESHIKHVINQIHLEKQIGNEKLVQWGIVALAKILKANVQYRKHDHSRLLQQLKDFTGKQDLHRKIHIADYIPTLTGFLK
jgi:molybdenum cofactor biosynthesis enzyme MoaA